MCVYDTKVHAHFSLKNLSLIFQYVLCKRFFLVVWGTGIREIFVLSHDLKVHRSSFSTLFILPFFFFSAEVSIDFTYTNFDKAYTFHILYLWVCVCELFPMHTHTCTNEWLINSTHPFDRTNWSWLYMGYLPATRKKKKKEMKWNRWRKKTY